MNFYIATYKRQYYKDNKWEDAWYNNQKIIVLANSQSEADAKVSDALPKIETINGENYRAVLTSNPVQVSALLFEECFDDSNTLRGV